MREVLPMKILSILLPLILFPALGICGTINIDKGAVAVTALGGEDAIRISGAPGSVTGVSPIRAVATNRTSGASSSAVVKGDGGFSLLLSATAGQQVRLTFVDAEGSERNFNVKVPSVAAGGRVKEGRARVDIDLSPFARFGAPEVIQVLPDEGGGTRVNIGEKPERMYTPGPTPVLEPTAAPTPSPSEEAEGERRAVDDMPEVLGGVVAPPPL